jgi:hypothetical protein
MLVDLNCKFDLPEESAEINAVINSHMLTSQLTDFAKWLNHSMDKASKEKDEHGMMLFSTVAEKFAHHFEGYFK